MHFANRDYRDQQQYGEPVKENMTRLAATEGVPATWAVYESPSPNLFCRHEEREHSVCQILLTRQRQQNPMIQTANRIKNMKKQ